MRNPSSCHPPACVEKYATDSNSYQGIGGDIPWSEGSASEVTLEPNDEAEDLAAIDFLFAVPSGRTASGIKVTFNIECPDNIIGSVGNVEGGEIQISTNNGAKVSNSNQLVSGLWPEGPTDKVFTNWTVAGGGGWTTDDFLDSSLAVNLVNVISTDSLPYTRTAKVNSVKLEFCYGN